MNSERWKQVDDILQSALDCALEERDAFLRSACGGDDALEREVRSLLTSDRQAGRFLERPAMEVAARGIALGLNEETPESTGSLDGRTISHYRIVEKLGRGGMGVVWKACDTRLDRFVALKLLPAVKMSDPERKRRFVQEARAASALNHPNIITIYDIDRAGPEGHAVDFIAMEFVPGKPLHHVIPRKGLPLSEVLTYAIQVADALAAVHASGIVHRDLKPGNVMVNEDGRVKLLDFGLAMLTEPRGVSEFARTDTNAQALKTDAGMIVGTVAYMSPEQAQGKRVDARTDIFSFGAVLYEAITGRRAFVGDSMASLLSAILRDEPKPAAEIAHDVPRELGRIVTRCLQKDPNRRYQHAGDLKIDLQQVKEGRAAVGSMIREEMPVRPGASRWRWLVSLATCMAISFAVGWRLQGPVPALSPWNVTRLTADAGLSGSPALSPDGTLVAYSSDRSGDGERDLYVKQVAGGQPIRLTSDGAGNTMPDFSPDGSKIVFQSNRDGGGIYEIPAFGGDVRLVAREGLNPKFSPDGTQVAYWVGVEGLAAAIPGTGTVWVVHVSGSQPHRVGPNLTSARHPIWSPDGKHLLVIGYTSAKSFENSAIDWWLAATDGSDAVRSGVYEELVRAGLRARVTTKMPSILPLIPKPACWSAIASTVIFSLASGGTENLWEIGVSPRTGKVSSTLKRLTTGAGNHMDPSCAMGGTLAFTAVETRSDVWSLPFDLDRGTSKGALERVTTGPAWREHASLAASGRYLAFSSDQSGRKNIWVRDLATGKESSLANSSFEQLYPVTSASGARVAFSAYEKDSRVVYVSTPGGAPEKVCDGCLRATDWSRDEKTILVFSANPYQVNALDVASHRQWPILKHPNYNLLYARFSPDNRSVSVTVRTQPNRARIAIAPLDGPTPVPESAWETIAEVGSEDWANWSPDGKTLYFTSSRDGHSCFWGQRIEASSHRPAGEAFAVQHLHGRVSYYRRGWSAAGGRITMVLVEDTGNVWMMSRPGTR